MREPFRLGMALVLLLVALAPRGARADETAATEPKAEADRSKLIYVDPNGKEKLIEEGGTIVKRGYLGIELTELTPELRLHFGAPESAGVMIARVVPGSPAERAGLRVGDIITALDGSPVESSWDMRARVRPLDEGAVVQLEVRRDGQPQTLSATLEQRERREVDFAPLLMNSGDADRIMSFRLTPGAGGEGSSSEGAPAGPKLRLRAAPSPREEMLERKLKGLEKRLKELESRIPKN
jgi:membrane-associated protease RseP (regulator of RpoE activity)